jgi:dolichol-phosphate mannosyltransferase
MKVTVVIAAYNEAENIGPLTQRLIRTLDSLKDTSWSLIYIIEGTDGTVDIARGFAVARPEIEIQYDTQPSGLGRAFRRGFDSIPFDADFVVTMDADQNHQPEEIPRLLDVARDTGADIVVGSRRVDHSEVEGMPHWKSAISGLVNHVMRIMMGVQINDMTSGFRVYRATALREIQYESAGFAFLPEILIIAACRRYKIAEAPIRFVFREAGESKMRIPSTGWSYLSLFVRHFLASIFSAERHADGVRTSNR